jgi:iron complex outermembrane receptor protein
MSNSQFAIPFFTALLLIANAAPAQDAADSTEGEPIIITGSASSRSLSQMAQPASELSGEELRLQLQPTLGETLSHEPGVSATSFAPGASRPVIRGLDADRIRVLQNGVGTVDASTISADHAVTIEPIAVDQIEVVRGPATLLYGTSAVGGVVNVIDNRIPDERFYTPLSGSAEFRLGSVDDLQSGALLIEGGKGPIAFHFDAFHRETDDLSIPGYARSERLRKIDPRPEEEEPRDILPNSAADSEGAAAGLSFVWDGGYVGAAYSAITSRYGTVAEPDVTIDLEQRRLDLRGTLKQPVSWIEQIKWAAGMADYEHTEFEGSEVGTVFSNEGFDARLELFHANIGPVKGELGFQSQRSDFSAVGAEALLPPTLTQTQSVFLFEELVAEPLRYQAGGRFDFQSVEADEAELFGPGETRDFRTGSGSAGVVWDFAKGYSSAVSVAYTQRAPTAQELFANGPHVATGAFEIGDRSLDSEVSTGIDFTLRKTEGFITGSVTFFYNHFDGFITLEPTGASSEAEPGEEGLPIFAYEAVDARFFGGEAEATLRLWKTPDASEKDGKQAAPEHKQTLDLELRSDYVHATNLTSHDPLPRIPPFRFGAILSYRHDNFGASIEMEHVSDQHRTAEFELPTDDYTLLNANLTYRFNSGPLAWELFVRGTNLTDAEARNHVSFLKDIAPLPGRGVVGGVRVMF